MSERERPLIPANTAPNSERHNSSTTSGGVLDRINKRRGLVQAGGGLTLLATLGGCASDISGVAGPNGISIVDWTEKKVTEIDPKEAKKFTDKLPKGCIYMKDNTGADLAGGPRAIKFGLLCGNEIDEAMNAAMNVERDRRLVEAMQKGESPKAPVVPVVPIVPLANAQATWEEVYGGGGVGPGTFQTFTRDGFAAFVGGMWYAIGQALRRPDKIENNMLQTGGGVDVRIKNRLKQGQGQGQGQEQGQGQSSENTNKNDNNNDNSDVEDPPGSMPPGSYD